MSTAPLLQPFELELVCFNAKLKDSLVLRSPKNDDRDAFDVAAWFRFGELPVSYVPSDFRQGGRRLPRYRFCLSKTLSSIYQVCRSFGLQSIKCYLSFFIQSLGLVKLPGHPRVGS